MGSSSARLFMKDGVELSEAVGEIDGIGAVFGQRGPVAP